MLLQTRYRYGLNTQKNYLEVCEGAGQGEFLLPQELDIAALIREGLTNKKIACRLNISVSTVNFHRANLRKKLYLRSTCINLRSHLMELHME